MQKTCRQCQTEFEVLAEDLAFYDKVSPVIGGQKFEIPPPGLCAECRQQRRLAFRNERKLYHRKCDFSGKQIISVYSQDKPYKVYASDIWWSDKWSALDYGRDFDFSRPFFEQFMELLSVVPLLSNMVFNSTNCEFNLFCTESKDCYMSSRVGHSQDICYSYLPIRSVGSIDCYNLYDSQYCYECLDCWNCYNSLFLQLCKNCSDCILCYDCIGARNCFGSVGLRNAEYYFFNKKCTKEEYEALVQQYDLKNYRSVLEAKRKFYEDGLKYPRRALMIENSQNVSGDYVSASKDVRSSFDIEKSDTVADSWGVEYSRDVFDGSFIYHGEQCYESISNSTSSNIKFSFVAINSHDLLYCMMCFNGTSDCFGCVSLQRGKYCILNKQYSKEEYEALLPRIIEHMQKTGQWGEFFPVEFSPFGYNETVASEYFPLAREEVLKRGWSWHDEEPRAQSYLGPKYELPDRIEDIEDAVCGKILLCEVSGRLYKIIPQELKFYREMGLPIPRKCPDQRYQERMALRNPRRLWERNCAKCGQAITTTYALDRPEQVYCEACYLKELY